MISDTNHLLSAPIPAAQRAVLEGVFAAVVVYAVAGGACEATGRGVVRRMVHDKTVVVATFQEVHR